MMTKKLEASLSLFSDKISECIKSNTEIGVVTHIDCDGLTSGAIITKALIRAGAKVTTRTAKEMNDLVIKNLKEDSRSFHVVTDLGGGFAKQFNEALGDAWFVLDHHEIPEDEHENERVINAWKFGINGGVEICAGGMAYLAAKSLNKQNSDLAAVAVVSALGDRQDQGEKKSFVGKNIEIVEEAKEQGLVQIDLDVLLVGRETRDRKSVV